MKDFYTIQDAADILGKSPQTVRRMIKKGELDAQRIKTPQGFHYVVRRDAVGVPKAKRSPAPVILPDEAITQVAGVEEIPPATEENVQKSEDFEAPIQMLDNLYVQNPPAPQPEAKKTVLTNQTEILTSRNGFEAHKQAEFEGVDKVSALEAELKMEILRKNADFEMKLQNAHNMHHYEKLGLFKIVDSLQTELERERRKPRSLMAYFMEWLLS